MPGNANHEIRGSRLFEDRWGCPGQAPVCPGDRLRIRESRRTTGRQLEDGVMAEGIVVVLVLVVAEDAVDAGADHVQEGVVDLVGIAAIVAGGGESMGQTDVVIELAHREGPASLVRADRDGSTRMDKPKKSKLRR